MGFTQEEKKRIKQYAETIKEKSLGVKIKSKTLLLMDDNHIAYGTSDKMDIEEQKGAYKDELLFLLQRDFIPIRRLFEQKFAGRVQTLKEMQQQLLSEIKGYDWIRKYENRFQPDFSTGITFDQFVDELLDGAKYVEEELIQPAGAGRNKKQPWLNDAPDYMLLSEAIVKFAGGKPAVSTLSKKIKPDGLIRYMRKGQRCKVHIGDFREYAQQHYPSDTFAGEIADEYIADIEARKAEEKKHRRRNNK